MSNKNNSYLSYEELLETDGIQRTVLFILSCIGIFSYFLSLLIIIFYIKKITFIKSRSFSFILLNSLTNLFELTINQKKLLPFKKYIIFISYLFQFHLIISSINRLLSGKQIFKSEKDFSLKKLLYIEILLPFIIYPYAKIFQRPEIINFFQNLIIIILLLCFYEYVKNKINKVLQYLTENNNNKDIIEIAYMESEELIRIYNLLKNLWYINFVFILLFYIIKFFDILLIKIEVIHYIISIALVILRELVSLLFFAILTAIVYLLNSYNKGEIIKDDEEENNLGNGGEGDDDIPGELNIKGDGKKIEIELDDINIERNKKKEEYKHLDNSQNEDNIIEIENLDISNGKEKDNNEEEKLDEEDENYKINKYSKETDKLK